MTEAIYYSIKFLSAEAKKYNPIPYEEFRKALFRNIKWARVQRGNTVKFDELAAIVKDELLKKGISIQDSNSNGNKIDTQTVPLFENTSISPLLVKFSSTGDAIGAAVIFDWLAKVLASAKSEKLSSLEFSVNRRLDNDH